MTIEQFDFKFAGHGHYKVRYTTKKRGDSWVSMVNDMTLIDATKGAEEPTQRDMIALRRHLMYHGIHYNKEGKKIL